jgi:hypothetical protein
MQLSGRRLSSLFVTGLFVIAAVKKAFVSSRIEAVATN